jgi:CheY-like chemotaxis protein
MTSSQQTNSKTEPSVPLLDLSNTKVLVVEDDAGTRKFVAFALEQYQADVTAVESAQEALLLLAKEKPDILAIDIGMPKVDGYTLIRQIRAMTPEQGGQIPAIALTAYVGEQDQRQALAAGFQIHVPKPVEPAELVAVIAQLTGKKQ